MRTGIPDALREIVENDAYLSRVQKSMTHRINYLNRHGMTDAVYITEALRSRVVEIRASYRQQIDAAALDTPIVYSAVGVRHIGVLTFLRLAIYIDIAKADTPAALWRYCGVGVTNGRPDTVATTKWPGIVRYNEKARRALGDVRTALMRKDSTYRHLYNTYRQEQVSRGVKLKRAHLRASRYVVKVWLKHLWLVWRRQAGLPVGPANPGDMTQLTAPFGWR